MFDMTISGMGVGGVGFLSLSLPRRRRARRLPRSDRDPTMREGKGAMVKQRCDRATEDHLLDALHVDLDEADAPPSELWPAECGERAGGERVVER